MPTEPISGEQQSAAARRAIAMANVYARNTGKMPPVQTTNTEPLRIMPPHFRMVAPPSRLPVALPRPTIVDEDNEEQNGSRHNSPHLLKGTIFIILGITLYLVLANASHFTSPTRQSQQSATPSASVAAAPKKIVHPVVRIGQADPSQYASTDEYNTWWASVCSTTSMTEIFNAYGRDYKITNVLKVESGLENPQEISSDQGLLQNSAIDRTASYFGFQTTWLHESLDEIIQRANDGNPIIVNFPPERWTGGHFLVVTGGNSTEVDLADSSKLDMQVMSHQTFMKYWAGLAALVTPKLQVFLPSGGDYSVIGGPTLSPDFINQVLAAYNSPAAGKGQALYDLGLKYGIDPAFALGFFFHESTFGTAGEARITLALGNLRCIQSRPCVNTEGSTCQTGQSCYAKFYSWEDGFEGWYIQIRAYINGSINEAIGKNACPCTTTSQIIPVYAPPTDGNDDSAYIKTVNTAIDTWHSAKIWVPKVA